MHAMKLTPELFEIAKVLDPQLTEMTAEHLVDSYLVIDSKNRARYVVKASEFQKFFEILSADYAIPVLKVKKKS